MTTTVINIKDAPIGWQRNPNYVYIGRPGKGLTSIWGNPYSLAPDSNDIERAVVVQRHQWYLYETGLALETWRLTGKVLVCFCSPKNCHGDTLARLADSWEGRSKGMTCEHCGHSVPTTHTELHRPAFCIRKTSEGWVKVKTLQLITVEGEKR